MLTRLFFVRLMIKQSETITVACSKDEKHYWSLVLILYCPISIDPNQFLVVNMLVKKLNYVWNIS